MSVANTCRIDGLTVLAVAALTAVSHPYDTDRYSQAVQCAVDVMALDGGSHAISTAKIGGGQTAKISIGEPYHVLIVNSIDQPHRLHISIVNDDDPGAHVGAFIGIAASNPLIAIDHVGEMGEGKDMVGFTEVFVECQRII